MSETLTYDEFRQLLIAKMKDENTKARINMELSKMTYTKDTNIDEYVKKMVTLLRAKTPGIREAAACEKIMDRLPAWAQDGIRILRGNRLYQRIKNTYDVYQQSAAKNGRRVG